MMSILVSMLFGLSSVQGGVREVVYTSCDVIRVNLGLGMTTQIVFEQEPRLTLYADHQHFRINTNDLASRSLAIIPFVEASEINDFRDANGKLPGPKELASLLDQSFKTNLFVFFDNSNQLMFELRFVEKKNADFVLKVKQDFDGECAL